MEVDDIEITGIERDEPLTLFKGKAKLGDDTVTFEGVMFNSVGGPNINIKLTDESRERLAALGLKTSDIEEVETAIQLRVIQGEMLVRR